MILPKISSNLFIDEVPENNQNNAVHIFTRPFDLTSTEPRQSLSIYATDAVKTAMLCSHELRNDIKRLQEYIFQTVPLPNDKSLTLRIFSNTSSTLAGMLLIEHEQRQILYTGEFSSFQDAAEIIFHPLFYPFVWNEEIDDIYLDATTIDMHDYCLLRPAIDEIERIVKSQRQCHVHLHVMGFGFEEIFREVSMRDINVYFRGERKVQFENLFKKLQLSRYLSANEADADITIIDSPSCRQPKASTREVVNITLTKNFAKAQNDRASNSYKVHYSKHPTLFVAEYLINLVRPLRVFPIDSSQVIPRGIMNLCRKPPNPEPKTTKSNPEPIAVIDENRSPNLDISFL